MKKVLSIAGSDCSGGAGIQADIKTITAHRMYAMSVITALTAQNTTGVFGVFEVAPDFIGLQMDAVMTDISPDSVKIGMVSSAEIIGEVASALRQYQAKNIVVDPVMVSTSGGKLLNDDAVDALIQQLLPLADVITPNIPEAECLAGFAIRSKKDMEKAALVIARNYDGNILIKGGHLADTADDLLYAGGSFTWFPCAKIENPNTHGTGCTLSSAIACNLAAGQNVRESIKNAKAYITGALRAGLDLGQGSGPLNHCYAIK